jgi:3-hydroxyacyl-CoA dehydrogenase
MDARDPREGHDMAEGALVRFENEDGIGVITIDNPPVNALSPGVPEGIIENIERGNADPAIKAIVLISAPAAALSPAPTSASSATGRPRY